MISNSGREWTSIGHTDQNGLAEVWTSATPTLRHAPADPVTASTDQAIAAGAPQPWYAYGTLSGPDWQAEVLVRLDKVSQELPEIRAGEDPTLIATHRTDRSWAATVAGDPEQLSHVIGDVQWHRGPAPVLELAVPGSTHQVTVREVKTSSHLSSMTHRRGAPVQATITGQGSPFVAQAWNAGSDVPQAARVVPSGYRMIGGSISRWSLDDLIGRRLVPGSPDMEILLDAVLQGRRWLQQGAPHAPVLTAIDYLDQDTLVVWGVAIEEILSGPFSATLIDGPAQGRTLDLEGPRRVIQVPTPGPLPLTGAQPEMPEPVDYRPVPGRPRWYSIHGGPIT
ncbi:hypothetical protein ACWFMI_23610 [Nocardiopsis terrae]|uniref:hypothetical protein n=1 Tax=Streptomyces sp. NPDC057554 TaxID=3350538 RepID=UPI0036CA5EEB